MAHTVYTLTLKGPYSFTPYVLGVYPTQAAAVAACDQYTEEQHLANVENYPEHREKESDYTVWEGKPIDPVSPYSHVVRHNLYVPYLGDTLSFEYFIQPVKYHV